MPTILLEAKNTFLEEAIRNIVKSPAVPAPGLYLKMADFDDVVFIVANKDDAPNVVLISLAMKCYGQLLDMGGREVLDRLYGSLVAPPEDKVPGADLTLRLDWNTLPEDRDGLIAKIANLKRNLLGAPMLRVMTASDKNEVLPAKPLQIAYRSDEFMWVIPKPDGMLVAFSLRFKDAFDTPIAKVFLHEFDDARRDPKLNSAPRAMAVFSRPAELADAQFDDKGVDGYVLFVLFKRHFEGERREKVISQLQTFRNYLQYHIKCTKAYIHHRMRSSYTLLLQSLNRARPEQAMRAGKKTWGGRDVKPR